MINIPIAPLWAAPTEGVRLTEEKRNWAWAGNRENERVPPEIDPSKPSVARVYDFMIGGKDNFAVDREVAQKMLQIAPEAPYNGKANRAFLRRAVTYMAQEAGIRQFLDIGSGLPTVGNVHEVAHEVDPSIRVVYVDNDPIVLVHGRAILADNTTTTVVQADVREPESILENPEVRKFIDFREPVGLLFVAILHHLKDEDDPAGLAARFYEVLAPGSHVAISHFCNPGDRHPGASRLAVESERVFAENLGTGRFRTPEEIQGFFGDLELIEPGLVPPLDWRQDPETVAGILPPNRDLYHCIYAGVARKN
ncbi:S-adenosyl methyltransferase [Thermopolyspora flexuosa]|jgi:SAM-dependent methyltransferase|uniref:S-adenosyl methyltransferase n=1 Tax=Thermopolyspora flexuosa TaxID=103836 RepID=A0A543J252_9ACTN|nr:S-adenosyl methyltransferase [Thermopolyspora flexuosa]